MPARRIVESAVVPDELRQAAEDGPEAVARYCDEHGLARVAGRGGSLFAVDGKWMVDTDRWSVKPIGEWVDTDSWRAQREFDVPENDFNGRFWARPEPLYHATQPENAEAIQRDGLETRARTRGISNRGVGPAVYTTTSEDEAAVAGHGSYGPLVFEIDTGAMKRDGYTPTVSQEPAIEEQEYRAALASFLGDEWYESSSDESDMSPTTVVVHGGIPSKYLKIVTP